MTYADFVARVLELLPLDAEREGAKTLLARSIDNALIDLQRNIGYYQDRQVSVVTVDKVTPEGAASMVLAPSGGTIVRVIFTRKNESGDITVRQELERKLWSARDSLSLYKLSGFAVSPNSKVFIAYPALESTLDIYEVEWSGRKTAWLAADDMGNFGDEETKAVSLFAKAQLLRVSENDEAGYASHMRDYAIERRSLYIGAKDKTGAS